MERDVWAADSRLYLLMLGRRFGAKSAPEKESRSQAAALLWKIGSKFSPIKARWSSAETVPFATLAIVVGTAGGRARGEFGQRVHIGAGTNSDIIRAFMYT